MDAAILKKMLDLESANIRGKRVLLRADLNVPMREGMIGDTTRTDRLLPTLERLAGRGAKIILLSHFGRPKGAVVAGLSLRPVAQKLEHLRGGKSIVFIEDCQGEEAVALSHKLADGEVALVENLRFYPGEEANDRAFAESLARLGDIFVMDAFSVSHRAHASTEALAKCLPAYPGPLMCAEIEALTQALEAPKRPLAALVGGAKISTKIQLLSSLMEKVETLIIGGGMANTFLYALGHDVGCSLCQPDFSETAQEIMGSASRVGCEIILPQDVVVARTFEEGTNSHICPISAVPADHMILDVGPETIADLSARLAKIKTLLWNGPLGAFEVAPFGEGTFQFARAAARATKAGTLFTIAGGGDTVAALNGAGVLEDFTYISTAGGAFLEWLEGRDLPGVMALIPEGENEFR